MHVLKCHILFCSLFFLLFSASAQGKSLSIEHSLFKFDRKRNIYTYTQPRVTYGNTTISGSGLVYDKNTEIMLFSGNVVIHLPGIVLTADKAQFDRKNGRNTLHRATMYDSNNGTFVDAERIEQVNDDEYIIYKGSLTRCRPDARAWELRGQRIVYMVDNYAYSINTSVHFYFLPIFYSPYFSWPTRLGRSTGLLMPTYSSVDSTDVTKSYGSRLKLPYFIALDRDHDVTITTDIIQRRGLGVDVDYLYAFTPDMSGRFHTWFIKETAQERDLSQETMGSLSSSDDLDLKPQRYRYEFDHRQNIFLNGQFFFHQHENSDNEINKEYFDAAVTLDSHFSRQMSLLFPWSSGNLSIAHETDDTFIYESTYDKTTDEETHLNKQPTVTVAQRFSRIADTPLSASLSSTGTQYNRTVGWNGQLVQGSVLLKAPFYYDFLNIQPSLQRTWYNVDTTYQTDSSSASQDPESFNLVIDQRNLELNFEIYRLFYNDDDAANRKLSFTPRIIYSEIQDVDQSQGDSAGFISTVLSMKTLTYKLESRYLLKNMETKKVRTFLSLDLTQIYNLQMENDSSYLNQPSSLETEDGETRLPLRLNLTLSPTSLFSTNLFYRFDHNIGRVIETGIGLSTRSAAGDSFALSYIKNETAYYEPDNTYHPAASVYTIAHNLKLNDRWTLYLAGEWDQSRSDLSTQYSDTTTVQRLDRQLTDLNATLAFSHGCYQFSAAYDEDIESELQDGITTEYLEKKITLTLQFQVMPTTGSVSTGTIADQIAGPQYQEGFLLPN